MQQQNSVIWSNFILQGFVVVEDLLDKALLLKARKAVDKLVDDLANKLYDAGKITSESWSYCLYIDLLSVFIHIDSAQ